MPVKPTLIAFALAIGLVAFFPSAQAGDDDMTTAQFVAQCSADPHSCQTSVGMGVVMGLSGPCVPDSMMVPSDAQILQVIDWLKAHPDVYPDDWESADDAAIRDLYPCQK